MNPLYLQQYNSSKNDDSADELHDGCSQAVKVNTYMSISGARKTPTQTHSKKLKSTS